MISAALAVEVVCPGDERVFNASQSRTCATSTLAPDVVRAEIDAALMSAEALVIDPWFWYDEAQAFLKTIRVDDEELSMAIYPKSLGDLRGYNLILFLWWDREPALE